MREASEDRAAADEAGSGSEQTAGEQEQAWSDRDQLASDRDQRSADADQNAADEDLEAGGDAVTHRNSRMARQRTTRRRDVSTAERGASALQRQDAPARSPDEMQGGRTATPPGGAQAPRRHLRVLVADEGRADSENLGQVVSGLGHEVVARVVEVKEVGVVTTREHPDVALVWLGVSSGHALDLIDEIVHEASCPVIALLPAQDSAYVHEAAKRGIFAYIVETGPEELQSAIDITLRRFAEYHDLQGAFGRRAVIEQAKGMLMARHGIDGDKAFELLRKHSQHGGRRLSDIAAAVVETNTLLPPETTGLSKLAARG